MDALIADADSCVKCGLCLTHCPTYGKTQNENESPRGRIALIQAVALHALDNTPKLRSHIDNCLLCRACESVCPAEVPYSRLIDNFRSLQPRPRHPALALTLLKLIAQNPGINRWAHTGLAWYQKPAIQHTARWLKLPQHLKLDSVQRLLPPAQPNLPMLQQYYPALSPSQATVGLFIGCLSSLLDRQTVLAAITVLTAIGYNVTLPAQQGCCGALALHDGDSKTAHHLESRNSTAFADPQLSAIVTLASGCGCQLQAYKHRQIADKVIDISQFLSVSGALAGQLAPLPATVCLHTPCTLKNAMHQEQGALKLLQLIPDIDLKPLPTTLSCCGSAGSYMLTHPQMAQALLADVLAAVQPTHARYLLSSNLGCALHIAAGLREQGIVMEVLHPVVLIARQLRL